MAVLAMPGAASGSTTSRSARSREAPSSIAASSRSRGSWRKNAVSSQTASGVENVRYGSTRPGVGVEQPQLAKDQVQRRHDRDLREHRDGQDEREEQPFPGSRSRARAYAHSAATGRASSVVRPATMSELRIGTRKSRSSKSAR